VLQAAASTNACANSSRLAQYLADAEQEPSGGSHKFVAHSQHITKVSADVLPQPDHVDLAGCAGI